MNRDVGLGSLSLSHSSPVLDKPYGFCGRKTLIVQELCESRGGRPGLSVLTSLLVFVDVKQY